MTKSFIDSVRVLQVGKTIFAKILFEVQHIDNVLLNAHLQKRAI